jgi:hypothetical protein
MKMRLKIKKKVKIIIKIKKAQIKMLKNNRVYLINLINKINK